MRTISLSQSAASFTSPRLRLPAPSLALLCLVTLALATSARGADDASSAGTGLARLWAEGKPALGYYVRPEAPADESSATPPRYSEAVGRELASNPLPDFAFLSLEHHYDASAARAVLAGLRGGGVSSQMSLLVRIPPISEDGVATARERVREVLAIGADGVVIPHVLSLEEARTALSFFDGINVWSPDNPDGDVIVMLIVEDPPVFDELQEIADLDGYSSLVCGIGSLTAALDGDRAAAEAINRRVLATARRAGLPDMITVDEDSVLQRLEQGFLGLLAYGPTANETLEIARRALSR